MFPTPGGLLIRRSLSSGATEWTYPNQVSTAPIVVGDHVVTATSTQVIVLHVADGGVVSTAPLTSVLGPDEQNVSSPLAGLAEANGILIVPAGTALVAY